MSADEEPTAPDGRAVTPGEAARGARTPGEAARGERTPEEAARGERPDDRDDEDDAARKRGDDGRDDRGRDGGDREDGHDGPRRPRRRMRRVVLVPLVALLVVVGFAGGVVTDRYLGVPCTDCAPRPGEAAPLVGTVASAGNGTLTVRTIDGDLVAVRTSTSPAVVRAVPAPGGLAIGTPVAVQGTRDADGALTVTRVEVTAAR